VIVLVVNICGNVDHRYLNFRFMLIIICKTFFLPEVKILINTGWPEPYSLCKKHTITVESLDNTPNERKMAETEEIKILEK
jgi:hypothetical protein